MFTDSSDAITLNSYAKLIHWTKNHKIVKELDEFLLAIRIHAKSITQRKSEHVLNVYISSQTINRYKYRIKITILR